LFFIGKIHPYLSKNLFCDEALFFFKARSTHFGTGLIRSLYHIATIGTIGSKSTPNIGRLILSRRVSKLWRAKV